MADEEEAEIIVGTYEDFVLGYKVVLIPQAPDKRRKSADKNASTSIKRQRYSVEQTFAVRGHSGSVRCLATSSDGSLAVSGGHDEVVNLFALKRRKLLQTVDGAFNCAAFVENSHLICGSEDSNIYIYECKAKNLILAKTLKGHKAAVSSISVHPSGKVLLSVSKDNTMRTWNLIKGRCAFVTQINMDANLVSWSTTGQQFLIASNKQIYLYNNSGILEHNIKLEKRVNSVEFVTDNMFLVASDSGSLEFMDLKDGSSLLKFQAHDARIKSVRRISESQSDVRFATASSDGTLKLWVTRNPGKEEPQELASLDIGARLTCMTTAISGAD